MKTKKTSGTNTSSVEPKNLAKISDKTGNIYESIVVIAKRGSQLASQQKEELHSKLAEFASSNDNLEEVFENREQIEISKFYEKQPNAALQATEEFLSGKVYFRNPSSEENNQ